MPDTDDTRPRNLPGGFTLTPLEAPGRWATMTHSCGDEVTFVNPSPERLDWYTGSHRCGGQGWQQGAPPLPVGPVAATRRTVEAIGQALDSVRAAVVRDVEPEDDDLAAVVLARLADAAAHVAVAAHHLATRGDDR